MLKKIISIAPILLLLSSSAGAIRLQKNSEVISQSTPSTNDKQQISSSAVTALPKKRHSKAISQNNSTTNTQQQTEVMQNKKTKRRKPFVMPDEEIKIEKLNTVSHFDLAQSAYDIADFKKAYKHFQYALHDASNPNEIRIEAQRQIISMYIENQIETPKIPDTITLIKTAIAKHAEKADCALDLLGAKILYLYLYFDCPQLFSGDPLEQKIAEAFQKEIKEDFEQVKARKNLFDMLSDIEIMSLLKPTEQISAE